ncbi:uncharacterized protein LOC134654129 [Cydia amplana]|uniref:uncharacterized protein LOC134654129 n=1 Tax=Cydia amplana TaxID=1869771 RepID=UPI002FE5FEE2
MFKTAVFLLVIFAVIFKANTLQCYVCYDCENFSDEYLTSCDSLLSTTTTTTVSVAQVSQPTSTSTSTSTSPSTTPSSTSSSTESTTSSSTTNTTESTTSNSTTTSTTTPTTNTTTTTLAPQSQVSDFAERLERANTSTTWECVKGTLPVNGSSVVVRGCAAGRTNETCNMFGLSSCSFCSTDKCNGAGSIQASAAVLAVAFFAYIVKDF